MHERRRLGPDHFWTPFSKKLQNTTGRGAIFKGGGGGGGGGGGANLRENYGIFAKVK